MTLPKKLFHYSKEEIERININFCPNKSWQEEASFKPNGFWFSVEEDPDDYSWFDWCKAENFRLKNLKYKHAVIISPEAKILHLNSVADIERFSHEYFANDPFESFRQSYFGRKETYIYLINWKNVQKFYDGIIISPYQFSCRLHSSTTWYYPWDCSSGCVWNLDKISIKLNSIIDVGSILDRSEDLIEEETSTDSLLASLVPLT